MSGEARSRLPHGCGGCGAAEAALLRHMSKNKTAEPLHSDLATMFAGAASQLTWMMQRCLAAEAVLL